MALEVQRQATRDFLVFGLSHVFPAKESEPSRGIATAWAAPVLKDIFSVNNEPPPVWAHPEGNARGPSVVPLYKSAPGAALKNEGLRNLSENPRFQESLPGHLAPDPGSQARLPILRARIDRIAALGSQRLTDE